MSAKCYLENSAPDTLSLSLGVLQTVHCRRIITHRKQMLPDDAKLKCQYQRDQQAENASQISQSKFNNHMALPVIYRGQESKL